jgi:hypothetical protein
MPTLNSKSTAIPSTPKGLGGIKGALTAQKEVKKVATLTDYYFHKNAAKGFGAVWNTVKGAVEAGGKSRMGFMNKVKKIYSPAVSKAWGQLKPYQQVGAVAAPAYMVGRGSDNA